MNDKYIKPPKKPCPVPCFVSGSSVLTKKGTKYVEDVVVGDRILTMDDGYQTVEWAGVAKGKNYIAYENSRFSPQHRILKRIGSEESLISAKHLARDGLAMNVIGEVTFIHFMFDRHQIVNVDGIWSESFFPGEWIMQHMDQANEIRSLFGKSLENFTLARKIKNSVIS